MQLTLQQTIDTILHWTASCKNEVHLYGIETAFEQCVRKVFETTHSKEVIDNAEALLIGAMQIKLIDFSKLGTEASPAINALTAREFNDSVHQMD